jgi:hypothetical protein
MSVCLHYYTCFIHVQLANISSKPVILYVCKYDLYGYHMVCGLDPICDDFFDELFVTII